MKQKLAELFNIVFGFRQSIVMLTIILIGIIFRLKSLIDGAEMVSLIKATAVAFMGSSSVGHMVTTVKEYMDAKGKVVKEETDDTGPVASSDESQVVK